MDKQPLGKTELVDWEGGAVTSTVKGCVDLALKSQKSGKSFCELSNTTFFDLSITLNVTSPSNSSEHTTIR